MGFAGLSERAKRIEPFHVMEIAKAASALAALAGPADPAMIYLNIGEPDFGAAPAVQAAAERAIRNGVTQYTPALGIWPLRERISAWYASRFGVNVSPSRIAITAGASAALQLACLAVLNPGDEVLMPDPSYPCNRQFVQAADALAKLLPTTAESRFQLAPEQVAQAWGLRTKAVLLATPSNPTGTSIHPDVLKALIDTTHARGGVCVVDEIYLALSHDPAFGETACKFSDQIISINSFSKYFCMTGWRLGWLVLPEALVPAVERLAQNLFICASTIAQHAALACFETDSIAEFERRRADFGARQRFFADGLEGTGLTVPVQPDGAFYVYADCTALCEKLGVSGSWDLAFELLRRIQVAATPGKDFGQAAPEQYLRFSTATALPLLQETLRRLHNL